MDGNSSFSLRKADLRLFRQLEGALRNLLKIPDLSPEDIVGLARAIRCIQRLPRCTPDTDVSVSVDYQTNTFLSSSTVRFSCDELSAEYSGASRLGDGYEYESFPSFTLRLDRDGEYEVDGDKDYFFTNFIGSAESIRENQGCTISVIDDSVPECLQPCDDEAV
jgi:hypothetical protein